MNEPEHQPAAPGPRFQFSLRTLLTIVAVCCLLLGLRRWGGEMRSRTAEIFLAIGVVILAVGVFLRRWWIVALGVVVVAGLAWEILVEAPSQPANLVVVAREWFQVVDLKTSKPIAGAHLRFRSDATSDGTADANGYVQLPAYSQSAFDIDYDYYDVYRDRCSLEVTAPGYASVRTRLGSLREVTDADHSRCVIVPMCR